MSIHASLTLPDEPGDALRALEAASATGPVVVFKKSPICPVSTMAEGNLRSWLQSRTSPVTLAMIDVIAERPLARGLTAALGIPHESPQALVFRHGHLTWHDSHGGLTEDAFEAAVSA
jgi:bacillithiol system protein YtxJ